MFFILFFVFCRASTVHFVYEEAPIQFTLLGLQNTTTTVTYVRLLLLHVEDINYFDQRENGSMLIMLISEFSGSFQWYYIIGSSWISFKVMDCRSCSGLMVGDCVSLYGDMQFPTGIVNFLRA